MYNSCTVSIINSRVRQCAPDEDEGTAVEVKGASIGLSFLLCLEGSVGLSAASIGTLGGGSGGAMFVTNSATH